MKIIAKPIRCGKTYDLIEYASTLKGYNLIVCPTQRSVCDVWKIILEKKYNIPQPITYQEFLDKKYNSLHVDSFLIDNIDLFIQSLSRTHISAITLTIPANEYKDNLRKKHPKMDVSTDAP
jgi:hypothetical protein